jgi:MoaA/NifB/PqqE/SkfB family radical SAM enzyme
MDLEGVCGYIHQLGIPQVNFKLATGDVRTLNQHPNYLLGPDELKDFVHFLQTDPLCIQRDNNLAYLRRTFNMRIFSPEDVQNGAPLKRFYAENKLRCYTPLLFSLIDYNGDVYPCCHLYRDNHGAHEKSKMYRRKHRLGNLKQAEFNFKSIWIGERYEKKRRSLTVIDPTRPDFYPCGECTRHCQHNIILNRVQELYNEAPEELENAVRALETHDGPVWF